MIQKPDFTSAEEALIWCREKYKEREKDQLGMMPPLEMFLMAVIEVYAAQAISLEKISKDVHWLAESSSPPRKKKK